MPAIHIHPPSNPFQRLQTPVTNHRDWALIWILLTVTAVVVIEIILAIVWIRIHNLRSKARWRRLRERGVVIVNGAALVWIHDLPMQNGVSYFHLKQAVERETKKVARRWEDDRE
jgi:hypothetical protein